MTTPTCAKPEPLTGDGRLTRLTRIATAILAAGDNRTAVDLPGGGSFIQLGGDSLGAMRLAAEAAAAAGVTLQVSALLSERPLWPILTGALSDPAAARPWEIDRESCEQILSPGRLSPAQRGMWINEHVVGSLPYNLVFTCFIEGGLRHDALAAALDATVSRHDGLRTVFAESRDGLERRVLERWKPHIDWRAWSGEEERFAGHVRQVAADEGRVPFQLNRQPGLRFIAISQRAGQRHALILSVHHTVLDGWAIGLVLTEIFARYDSAVSGLPLRLGRLVRFESYLSRQDLLRSTGEMTRQALFWNQYLQHAHTTIELPANRARPAYPEPHGARIPVDFGHSLSAGIRECAKELGITVTAFFLGAYALTLSRHTGLTDLLVGLPVSGRPTPELAELVAVTVNLVPVRISIDDGQTVPEYLAHVQRMLAASLENSDFPFQELVSQLGLGAIGDRHPLIQASFGMHAGLIPRRVRSATLDIQVEEGHGGGAQFDLQLFIGQSQPSYAGSLEYATGAWEHAEAAAFCSDVLAAARELADPAQALLENVRCIGGARRALLDRVNQTSRLHPGSSLSEEFQRQARQSPRKPAVREGDHELTYEQLAAAASAQARLLANAGVSPESTVLVGLQRSIAEVVAVVGTVLAGAAYVGVEADAPRGRVDQIVSTLSPAAVIGNSASWACRLPDVPSWEPEWNTPGETGILPLADPMRLAYVAFTSGSTGQPKGVCIPHRGVLRLVHGLADYAPVGPADRMLRFAPLAFDASTLELWGSLLTGATLEIHPPGLPDPAQIGRFIQERSVTVAWLTSGLFRLVSEYAADTLGGMRLLLTGGDVVPGEHVRKLLGRHPGLTIVNGYGPTENTTFTTAYRMTHPAQVADHPPIGVPVPNTQVHVLDHRQRLVPPGAIGELYAAGDGLATGYYGDSEQTRRSFGNFSPDVPSRLYRTGDIVRLDTSGNLHFLGRRDDQVKIRGFRVEVGEIRAALTSHPGVSDAFVTTTGQGAADKQLLACCIPASDRLAVPQLVEFLSARLPGYMVPALWAVMNELPLTANGKVDRIALQRAARPAATYQVTGS